jgi:hypothetical protein
MNNKFYFLLALPMLVSAKIVDINFDDNTQENNIVNEKIDEVNEDNPQDLNDIISDEENSLNEINNANDASNKMGIGYYIMHPGEIYGVTKETILNKLLSNPDFKKISEYKDYFKKNPEQIPGFIKQLIAYYGAKYASAIMKIVPKILGIEYDENFFEYLNEDLKNQKKNMA